jgi:hypothetical protein
MIKFNPLNVSGSFTGKKISKSPQAIGVIHIAVRASVPYFRGKMKSNDKRSIF